MFHCHFSLNYRETDSQIPRILTGFSIGSPVVTRADLMAAGDHVGCFDLMRAAIPATWGQDIEVPERRANPLFCDVPFGGNAAKMSTPGAAMSGYLRVYMVTPYK